MDVDYSSLDDSFSSNSTEPELDFSDLDESYDHGNQLLKQVEETGGKLCRVAKQLAWIEEVLVGLESRLERKSGCLGYRESLEVQVEALEGLRCVYAEYIHRKSEELDVLYTQVVREGVLTEDMDLSVYDVYH